MYPFRTTISHGPLDLICAGPTHIYLLCTFVFKKVDCRQSVCSRSSVAISTPQHPCCITNLVHYSKTGFLFSNAGSARFQPLGLWTGRPVCRAMQAPRGTIFPVDTQKTAHALLGREPAAPCISLCHAVCLAALFWVFCVRHGLPFAVKHCWYVPADFLFRALLPCRDRQRVHSCSHKHVHGSQLHCAPSFAVQWLKPRFVEY